MKIQRLRNYLADINPEFILLDNPCFDKSIIGYSSDCKHLIFSYDEMVEEFMNDNNLSSEEAEEFIQYNTLRALPYAGEFQPIVVMNDYSICTLIRKPSRSA